MRRSAHVAAPILASAAVALLAGCRPDMQRCVDESNRVVNSAYCGSIPRGSNQTTTGGSGGAHVYRYYYGGRGSYAAGSTVTGGSYAPASGHSYSTSTGTARGGFGGSFSSGHASGVGG